MSTGSMSTGSSEVSSIKSLFSFAVLTLAGVLALAGGYPGSRVRGAAPSAPHVTSITQITHDGHDKTNLVADDSQVYVTELSAANRVITRVSLPDPNRASVKNRTAPEAELATSLKNLQALDLS